jgi:hypothetical protein
LIPVVEAAETFSVQVPVIAQDVKPAPTVDAVAVGSDAALRNAVASSALIKRS